MLAEEEQRHAEETAVDDAVHDLEVEATAEQDEEPTAKRRAGGSNFP